MRILQIILFSLLTRLEAGAIFDSMAPPSDEELKASIVDHWDPSALVTVAVLVVLCGVLVITIVAWATSRTTRLVSICLFVFALFSGVHWILNHIALSNRAESLTGIQFGGFYGLF